MWNDMAGLSVGSKVHLSRSGFNSPPPSVAEITGETKTCWRIGKTLYRKSDGSTRGDGYYHSYIKEYSESNEMSYIEERDRRKQNHRLNNAIRGLRTEYLTSAECSDLSEKIEHLIKIHTH